MNSPAIKTQSPARRWQEVVAPYARSDMRRSVWMLVNTLAPYFALWVLMILSLRVSYLLTLLLALPAGGFLIRSFIIFHDCGHGSFFKSKKANDVFGIITGLLLFTPYHRWKHDHAIHHATSGDLDRRGKGDVYTMTVSEYLSAPWWKRVSYRILRNPFVLLVLGPPLVFVVFQRVPLPGIGKRERASIWWTNLAMAVMVAGMCLLIGWKAYLMIQLPVMMISTCAGVWLFYVQHNFDPTYWADHDTWEFKKAGLQGSSYYKLPAILQWFTGNIGFHHIHHLSPKIPNYNLPKCYRENPLFHVRPMTFAGSLKSLYLRLYDEEQKILVGWKELRQYRQRRPMTT
jgi:acyl-lipid omega-6 desaturase (Delta-12 desaturase)